MWKLEGYKGYFKGNGATVIKIVPFSAIEFYMYEVFKSNLYPGKQKHELSYMNKLVCGGLTGMCASFAVYPIDLVKTYLTINVDNAVQLSMWEQAKVIVRTQGFFGLYKGLFVSLGGIAPFIGIKMSSFDWLSNTFKPPKDSNYIVYYNLVIGATAGTIAVTVTYPTDLVRKLL